MCGISGFSNFKTDYTQNYKKYEFMVSSMGSAQQNRGPNRFSAEVYKNVCFAHNRLSIRDLSENGNQPMHDLSTKYTIIYNGEVYNAEKIKEDLIAKGYTFKGTSDTEVILNAYIEYGLDAPSHLDGIFAFAIYDRVLERVVLCRDRFGIKPLFYVYTDETLIFASTLNSIDRYTGFKLELDDNSFRELFGLFPSRTEGNGLFKGVREVKHGGLVILDKNGLHEKKYWELNAVENTYTYEEAIAKTKQLVTDSVLSQTVSDVPISTFLSGGLDSSIITAIISNDFRAKGKQLDTFSFDYEENSLYFKSSDFQVDEDKKWVKQMSYHFDTNHTYLECSIEDLFDNLYTAVEAKFYPSMTDIDSSLLYFCNVVSKTHKVALTGECADEIFGGYPWFRGELVDGQFPWIRDLDTRKMLLKPEFAENLKLDEYVKESFEKSISGCKVLSTDSEEDIRIRKLTYLNIKWFMSTLLERMDRMSMYSSLEARVPYANHELIEFLYNIPWDYKYRGVTKNLLREAFSDTLPHDLLYRKKSPYPKTYNPKYEDMLSERLFDIIYSNNSPLLDYVDKKKVVDMINAPKDLGKPWFGQLMAMPQLMAYYIQMDYFLRKVR